MYCTKLQFKPDLYPKNICNTGDINYMNLSWAPHQIKKCGDN